VGDGAGIANQRLAVGAEIGRELGGADRNHRNGGFDWGQERTPTEIKRERTKDTESDTNCNAPWPQPKSRHEKSQREEQIRGGDGRRTLSPEEHGVLFQIQNKLLSLTRHGVLTLSCRP